MAIRRGILLDFDAPTHTAAVRLDGASTSLLEGVAVSRALPAAEMTAGRRVLVETGDHRHPADAVVIAAW